MIKHNNLEANSVFIGTTMVHSIYKGTTLIWEFAKSCFGSDFWINDKCWANNEGWKN